MRTVTRRTGGCSSRRWPGPSGPAPAAVQASPWLAAPSSGTWRCAATATWSPRPSRRPSSNGWSRTVTRSAPGSLAFGGYQPARVVTNDELAATMDTSDEWIRSRVGVASRRLAGPDETVADMAVAAGGKALAASGLSPADIDLVIVATCTTEVQIPNTAATVARRLGIAAPGAYDMNAACAGFCYALANASDAVRTGTATHVLVIGAEKLSQWIDWTDRSTAIID